MFRNFNASTEFILTEEGLSMTSFRARSPAQCKLSRGIKVAEGLIYMNILFFNPPFIGRFSRSSRSPAVTKGGTLYYPIWLAYAVGVAEQAGHNVMLLDAPADGLEIDQVFDK